MATNGPAAGGSKLHLTLTLTRILVSNPGPFIWLPLMNWGPLIARESIYCRGAFIARCHSLPGKSIYCGVVSLIAGGPLIPEGLLIAGGPLIAEGLVIAGVHLLPGVHLSLRSIFAGRPLNVFRPLIPGSTYCGGGGVPLLLGFT